MYRDVMAEHGQIKRCGQSGGASPDDSDFASGGLKLS